MEKAFSRSRSILAVLCLVGCVIAFWNEHISVKVAATVAFLIAVMVMSYVGMPIAKKILAVGDALEGLYNRIMYYILVLIGILGAFVVIFWIASYGFEWLFPNSSLGLALLFMLGIGVVLMCMLTSYVQALIVLLLRGKQKENTEKENDKEA